jgi:hypothetical protein
MEEEAVARRPMSAMVDDGDLHEVAHEATLGGQGEVAGRRELSGSRVRGWLRREEDEI